LAKNQILGMSLGVRIAAIAALLLANCGVLHAQVEIYAQRQACKPDVFRLCSVIILRLAPITKNAFSPIVPA
jgi:hypothetical protein